MNEHYIKGKEGISAKIIADSIANGVRITTLELNYHRFIHSEFMTHRMFSRNASSSRAMPVSRVLDQVENSPAMPIHWGVNQAGMQAGEETKHRGIAYNAWESAAMYAADYSEILSRDAGVHKQISNRITEPFQFIKSIVTATEWDNFFGLRLHPDAQPEFQELARCMKEAMDSSTPYKLEIGEWHLPYVDEDYGDDKRYPITTEQSIKCSVARCARVSYNNHDNSSPDIDKDIALADKLLEAGHMSPFEHQATPMDWPYGEDIDDISEQNGITHVDKYGFLWSGNFRGWIQHRNLL